MVSLPLWRQNYVIVDRFKMCAVSANWPKAPVMPFILDVFPFFLIGSNVTHGISLRQLQAVLGSMVTLLLLYLQVQNFVVCT